MKKIPFATISSVDGTVSSAVTSIRDEIEDITTNISSTKSNIDRIDNDIKNVNDNINKIKRDIRDLEIETECNLKLIDRRQDYYNSGFLKHVKYCVILIIFDFILKIADMFLF